MLLLDVYSVPAYLLPSGQIICLASQPVITVTASTACRVLVAAFLSATATSPTVQLESVSSSSSPPHASTDWYPRCMTSEPGTPGSLTHTIPPIPHTHPARRVSFLRCEQVLYATVRYTSQACSTTVAGGPSAILTSLISDSDRRSGSVISLAVCGVVVVLRTRDQLRIGTCLTYPACTLCTTLPVLLL